MWYVVIIVYFFFQAEDGIRDPLVTGVQTCALPIFCALATHTTLMKAIQAVNFFMIITLGSKFRAKMPESIERMHPNSVFFNSRSEERRVGKSVDLDGRRDIKKKK